VKPEKCPLLNREEKGHKMTIDKKHWRFALEAKAMPYYLPVPKKLKAVWKIKIWDNEVLEEPHVTVLRKSTKWRYGLRRRGFMDAQPDPGQVPKTIRDLIDENYEELCRQWDILFPTNCVVEEVEDDDNRTARG
jgi:hypothetical protein